MTLQNRRALKETLRRALMPKEALEGAPKVVAFDVVVDYTGTFDQMLHDALLGRGGRVQDDDLTAKNFPFENRGRGRVAMKLCTVAFPSPMFLDQAVEKMGELGLRPADLQELLAFAGAHRFEQIDGDIIALGSILEAKGHRPGKAPVLSLELLGRYVGLEYYRTRCWEPGMRFLAVERR